MQPTTDFDQGFEPTDFAWPTAEYGDLTEGLARISMEVTRTFLSFEAFPMETTRAPVTDIVCLCCSAQFDGVHKVVADHLDAEGRCEDRRF
jgi:hypothetical protein